MLFKVSIFRKAGMMKEFEPPECVFYVFWGTAKLLENLIRRE